uniref:Uncharacterized protein n=1 Tax=Gopherus agassizii TaxID=38772 RepID=A0A452I8B7_9SAUR
MEYEEDDDISFAKWMSSFWGHSLIDENEKESRSYRKRQTLAFSERRASLPVRSVLIPSSHRHTCASSHQGQDVKCHCHTKACKISSPDGSGSTSRSNAIQEFSESFEKQLHFKIKRSVSLQPEGMKERRERARMCMSKSRSHKKEGGKREPKTEQKEEERPEISAGKQS